jgi:hypothetical protein
MSGTQQDFDKITPEELKSVSSLGEEAVTKAVNKYFGTEDDDSGVLSIIARADYDPRFLIASPAEVFTAGFISALVILDNRQDGSID